MFEEIKKNLFVYYSPNAGSNAYLLVGKKIALIDSSLKINSQELRESLASESIKPTDVDFVLHTHGHADHFGSDALFKNAEIKMHSFDAEYVSIRDFSFTGSGAFGQDFFPRINSFFSSGERISLAPFELEVVFTPGHTAGSVCFYDKKNKLLFSGDTLFRDGYGRTDLPSGDIGQMKKSIELISGLDFELLLPGHGLILKGSQEENINSVLKTLSIKYI